MSLSLMTFDLAADALNAWEAGLLNEPIDAVQAAGFDRFHDVLLMLPLVDEDAKTLVATQPASYAMQIAA